MEDGRERLINCVLSLLYILIERRRRKKIIRIKFDKNNDDDDELSAAVACVCVHNVFCLYPIYWIEA